MDELVTANTRHGLTRRQAVGLAGLGAAGIVFGGGARRAAAHTGTVTWHNEIWSQPTYSPDTGARYSEDWDEAFYLRYEEWLHYHWLNTPSNWTTPMRVWHGRVHDHSSGSGSWHYYGRACDQFNLDMTVGGVMTKVFDAKFKQGSSGWKYLTGTALSTARKRYWGTVAGLNYHFASVLHYWFTPVYFNTPDYSHEWHVHADNGISGNGFSVFAPVSGVRKVQVFTVQSCLNYIWGYGTTPDGYWGSQTRTHSDDVLAKLGRTGSLTSSQANWQAFLTAALRWGTGAQTSWGGGGGCPVIGVDGKGGGAQAIPC
jgi:hypothetical protein